MESILLSIPSPSSCPQECENLSLSMLFPSLYPAFALTFFPPSPVFLMSLWLPSFVSQLMCLFLRKTLCFHLSTSDHSLLHTLLCPVHTFSVHLCPLCWNLLQGWDIFNLQGPTWPLGQGSCLVNAYGSQEYCFRLCC